jgi:hypothetical protein
MGIDFYFNKKIKNPPYKNEGFERIDLDKISKKQICKIDRWEIGISGHSHTVSFRRRNKN